MKTLSQLTRFLSTLPGADQTAGAAWAEREPQLTKPAGSLGRLEEITQWLCLWQGRHPPKLDHVVSRTFAANHGVVARGVSAFPAEVTRQMVLNPGAAINVLCQANGAEHQVIPLDLDTPTADFTTAAAMSEADFMAAFMVGFNAVPPGTDLLIVGEMGIGNTTAAAAVACGLWGGDAAHWVGRGTGVDNDGLTRKIQAVEAAMVRHGGQPPLEILRRVGGRELAAMAGAVIAARTLRAAVLLDGYVCTAAVAPLAVTQPGALDHCLVAHMSAEPGHRHLLDKLGKRALLDFGMRLGEGSGAALAIGLVRSAVACHVGMATFAQAGVSGKE